MNILLKKFHPVKKILIFLSLGSVFTSNDLIGASLSCDVTASVAFLMNAENGKVLFAKNADEPLYPASTTKVATALYVLSSPGLNLDQMVTASSDALASLPVAIRRSGKHPSYRLEPGGTHMGLKVGEQMCLRSLLYGLMLSSANDASNVLAETISGSVSQFMTDLNIFLHKIGCVHTHFRNPHGLPDLEHLTTAKDLARIGQVAMKFPIFREIVSSSKYLRPETNKQPERFMPQGNALVKPGHKHYYPFALGIKTGYTVQAGHTLIASAKKGDRFLIGVVAHREGSDNRYRSMVQLFETAFQEVKENRTLFSAQHDLFQAQVEGAKDKLKAVLSQDVVVSFYPSEGTVYRSEIFWKTLPLPISQGEEVGEIRIFDEEGALQKTATLLAQRNVEATLSYKCNQLKDLISQQVHNKRREIGYLGASFLLGVALYRVTRRKKKESHKV